MKFAVFSGCKGEIRLVKGTSRRVVVVESPDPHLFEQAIFILRKDALDRAGVSAKDVIAEAAELAANCTAGMKRRRQFRLSALPRWLCTLAGAGGISLLWLAATIL